MMQLQVSASGWPTLSIENRRQRRSFRHHQLSEQNFAHRVQGFRAVYPVLGTTHAGRLTNNLALTGTALTRAKVGVC